MKIRLFGTAPESIVDGPGLRYAVFTQGCPHHCPGCHNPETHDPKGGHEALTEDLIKAMGQNPLLDGLTLSGGEPLTQPEACLDLARGARALKLNIWLYTGYVYEELLLKKDKAVMDLLKACDVLVDGPFILKERSLSLPFRGSLNQRLIDLKQSLETGECILWEPPVYC